MKKLFASVVVFAAVSLGAVIVQAEVFDPDTGTVTVMASGPTAYEDANVGPQTVITTLTVAAVTVPPGRYLLTTKLWVDMSVGGATFVQCGFDNGVAGSDSVRLGGSGSMALSGADEFAVQTTVEVACVSNDDVDIHRIVLDAISLSAVDFQ